MYFPRTNKIYYTYLQILQFINARILLERSRKKWAIRKKREKSLCPFGGEEKVFSLMRCIVFTQVLSVGRYALYEVVIWTTFLTQCRKIRPWISFLSVVVIVVMERARQRDNSTFRFGEIRSRLHTGTGSCFFFLQRCKYFVPSWDCTWTAPYEMKSSL